MIVVSNSKSTYKQCSENFSFAKKFSQCICGVEKEKGRLVKSKETIIMLQLWEKHSSFTLKQKQKINAKVQPPSQKNNKKQTKKTPNTQKQPIKFPTDWAGYFVTILMETQPSSPI